MRKLNVKLLLCLLAGLAVFSGGVAVAHHLQYRRIPVALLRQAQRAEDENDLKRAISYLDRYLSFAPDDAEQRARIALILADRKVAVSHKGRENALIALEKALGYDPGRHDLRRLAVPLAIQLRRLEPAAEHLKKLPRDGQTANLWGQWYEAKGRDEEAVTSYRDAVKLDPAQVETHARLARLLRERHKADPDRARALRQEGAREADAVMAALVQKNPRSWQARVARWEYRRDFHLYRGAPGGHSPVVEAAHALLIRDAAADVEAALEIAEGEPDVRLAAAEAAQAEGRLAAAREHLDKARQLHRKDPRVWRAFAGLELAHEARGKRPEERKACRAKALAWLRQGAEELTPPAQFDVLWAHASLLIETGGPTELAEADKAINKIHKIVGTPEGVAAVDFLRGRALAARQQWAEAARLLERSRPLLDGATDMANQIDLLLGRCYVELDEPAMQLAVYQRLAKRNPASAAAKLGMAAAARAMNRIDEALKHYAELSALEAAPPGAWVEYVRLLTLRARQSGRAEHWEAADRALDRAGQQPSLAAEVAVLRAEYHLAKDEPKKARAVLQQARDGNPHRVELWTAMATLAERVRDPDEALRVLDDAERQLKRASDQVEVRLARARHWAERRNDRTAAELKRLEAGLEAFSAKERSRVLNGLAEGHYHAGNYKEARRLWQRLAAQDEYRGDLRLRLVLFNMAMEEGHDDEMVRLLEEIRALEGEGGTFGRHAEARRIVWLVKHNKVEESEKAGLLERADRLVEQVKRARPSWSAPLQTRAAVEVLRGNPEQAIACLKEARALGDRNPLVVRQLVDLLRKQGKLQDADAVLRGLTRDDLVRANLEYQAATLSLMNRNPERAVELALQAVRDDSRDYRDHLWLGQLLASAGPRNARQAEQHLRRAVQLAGAEPDPYVAVVAFLAQEKRAAEAEGFLDLAKTSLKPEQAALVLARCSAQLDKPNDARKHFEAALKARPADAAVLKDYAGFRLQRGEMREAEALLRRMLGGEVKLSDDDAEWGHTRLALLLSAGQDHARFREALLHVGLKLENGAVVKDTRLVRGDTVGMRRCAARVLGTQPQWRCREEAIQRLEELERRQALGADDRFVLAKLYEARRDWPRALEQLSLIANGAEAPPQYLVVYAQALLRQKERGTAEKVLNRIRAAHRAKPNPALELSLVELQARWHEAAGEPDKAEKALRDRIDRPGADPQEVLLLVASYGRQDRFDKALGLLDRIWKCPPEMAGGTSVALLRSAKATDAQRELVVARLTEAMGREPKNAALRTQLGDVMDLLGKYEEAERCYHEALRLEPGNVMALNNLAWLLAQRADRGDEALRQINRAIGAVGPRGELLDTRAMVQLKRGRPAEALADLQDAVRESLTPTRCFHLARAHLEAKDRPAAARELRRAADLGLQAAHLHPVEQVVYRRLVEELIKQ